MQHVYCGATEFSNGQAQLDGDLRNRAEVTGYQYVVGDGVNSGRVTQTGQGQLRINREAVLPNKKAAGHARCACRR